MKGENMKRNKFLHNSFFNYIRSFNNSNTLQASGKMSKEICFIFISMFLLSVPIGMMNTNTNDDSVSIMLSGCVWMFGICLFLGVLHRHKPSVLNLLPLNYKKRVVYSYLADIVCYLLIIVVMLLLSLTLIAIICFFEFIFEGDLTFVFEDGESFQPVGIQGELFWFFMNIFVYSMAKIISCLNKKTVRYTFMFVFPIVLIIIAAILVNFSNGVPYFTLKCNVVENFNNLPLPWLWLTVIGVISALVFISSVLCVIDTEKPKDY